MSKIILIDDDYSTEIIVENLGFRGHEAIRISSAEAALQAIDEIIDADLVILDIIMERPQNAEVPNASGDTTTGMIIFKAFRERRPELPVLVFSASNNTDLIDVLNRTPHTTFLSKWNTPSLKDFLNTVEQITGDAVEASLPQSFVVHGHDAAEKLALKNYLQNRLGLPEPVILHEQPSLGRTIIEKLEDHALSTDLAFVLLTPDDRMASEDGTNDDKRRARQNVIFELGYFLGVFGRSSGRVFLLHKGPLELPSDLSGVIYIDVSKGVDAAGEDIRRELRHVL